MTTLENTKKFVADFENVKKLATEFLAIADKLNDNVSRYLEGSNDIKDIRAYEVVKAADKKFIDALNDFYGCKDYEYGLNYELAYELV